MAPHVPLCGDATLGRSRHPLLGPWAAPPFAGCECAALSTGALHFSESLSAALWVYATHSSSQFMDLWTLGFQASSLTKSTQAGAAGRPGTQVSGSPSRDEATVMGKEGKGRCVHSP